MKLLATDYDGTLRYAQDVMPEDLKSIEEWKNKGNKFVIVTGRSKESIDAQIKLFNLPLQKRFSCFRFKKCVLDQ